MNQLENLIIQCQSDINKSNNITTKIIISLGKFKDTDLILDVCQDNEFILKLIDKLNNEKKNSSLLSFKTSNSRCYKYQNMEYYIDKDKHINFKVDTKSSHNLKLIKGDIRLKVVTIKNDLIENFPCLSEYNSIVDKNNIIINYNNLFQIHIISEKNIDKSKSLIINRIEIHINNQNIYVDKLMNSINEFLNMYFELK